RRDFQSSPVTDDRFVQLSLAVERGAAIVVSVVMARVDRQRLIIAFDRLVESALRLQQVSPIVPSVGMTRIQLGRAAEFRLGRLPFSLPTQSSPQQLVRVGVVRLDL